MCESVCECVSACELVSAHMCKFMCQCGSTCECECVCVEEVYIILWQLELRVSTFAFYIIRVRVSGSLFLSCSRQEVALEHHGISSPPPHHPGGMRLTLWLCVLAGTLDSDLPGCAARALSTEPSPKPQNVFLHCL